VGNLLITGGAGFIGVNFVRYWTQNHLADRLVILDALTYAGNLASLAPLLRHPMVTFVHGDVRNLELVQRLLTEHTITTIVHFAAESHVDRSIHGPDAFIDTNILGTHALLKAARQVWLVQGSLPQGARFHHVSTDEVYGSLEAEDQPFREDSPFSPNSPYAASKAAADHLARAYHRTYNLPVTASNCSNNYGAFQFPEKLVPLVIINALQGKSLPVYGDGLNVRDWLYVEDHCRALEQILLRGTIGETYNVGGKNEWRNIDVVRLLCRLIDQAFRTDPSLGLRFPDSPAARGAATETLITFVKDRLGHDRRYAIDSTKLEKQFGVVPQESFESGISKTLSWYLENEPWWRGVMDGSYREWVNRNYSVTTA
jgi:dTDP-glucose 4,6-dehydratase